MMKSFKELIAWQKGYALTLEVYKATKVFPTHEKYGIISQLQRASSSIPANIAEGYERNHRKEYIQFLYIPKGSLAEVETFLMLSKDLGYLPDNNYQKIEALRGEASRVLNGLIKSLKRVE